MRAHSKDTKLHRPSAVSQSIRAVGRDIDDGANPLLDHGADCGQGLRLVLAANRRDRERAFRLASSIYSKSGFHQGSSGFCVSPYDLNADTAVLLIVDADGNEAGTISLVCDGAHGLPCDEVFGSELDGLRAKGRRLGEVTRLAVRENHPASKAILVHLYNWVSVYARRFAGVDDFVIEVNPRHESFYLRRLNFVRIAGERPCPRVGGAPAVLLRLDMHYVAEVIERIGGLQDAASGAESRTLYPFFRPIKFEETMAAYIVHQHKPMTKKEAVYFGIGTNTAAKPRAQSASATVG
ncbi:MAG: hypothetical protein L6R28_19000 [Planctomycetes bacterium]|nr:hypothetical protein [Planctomycetota bacterium]